MLPKIKILVPALALLFCFVTATGALAADQAVVNVNTADASELAMLPRVGPALSQRIIEDREANGPFETASDLLRVSGIGERTLALMKPWIATEGETTLDTKVRSQDAQERFEALEALNTTGDS